MERHMVTGKSTLGLGTVELFKTRNRKADLGDVKSNVLSLLGACKNQVTASSKFPVDISMLPAVAKVYNLSPNISDYIVVGVPSVTSDFPNRNLQAMPFYEISSFHPKFGRIVYQTFKWKPTFQDHQNDDVTQAKGINFDVVLAKVPKYNIWKILTLSGFDRTKDPSLVRQILNKERTCYSMGAWVPRFACSVCGADAARPMCSHFMNPGKGGITEDGKLVYQVCLGGLDFFENSSVGSPADPTAFSDDIISF